ncbi:Variable major outer membrane lipoprotein (plasmid) [Borrelia crocidurae DOU]|uniref:Variable major outer membrane lipoprotein n=1 Tax=Borrelia crocidurae DOU TaxID=1293575 RepID=W5SKY7_9SPIR|nr:Variable major outer membrane lipoprotein [Borrelia crocidurae DOU]
MKEKLGNKNEVNKKEEKRRRGDKREGKMKMKRVKGIVMGCDNGGVKEGGAGGERRKFKFCTNGSREKCGECFLFFY